MWPMIDLVDPLKGQTLVKWALALAQMIFSVPDPSSRSRRRQHNPQLHHVRGNVPVDVTLAEITYNPGLIY